jgi:hypothetical protein
MILWLYSYNGKIIAIGTRGFETGSCSLDLVGCSQSWEVATVVFCWMLMMTTTAACFQADTSDSENKLSSHLSRAAMMYLQYFEPNDWTPVTTTPRCSHDVTQPVVALLLHT